MTSPAKIQANRRNALRSTGPRTVAGKTVSSKNAMRHGLLSTDALLRDEDAAEFASFREQLESQLAPCGPLEEILVDRIAMSVWRLGRVHRLEASMFAYRIASAQGGFRKG